MSCVRGGRLPLSRITAFKLFWDLSVRQQPLNLTTALNGPLICFLYYKEIDIAVFTRFSRSTRSKENNTVRIIACNDAPNYGIQAGQHKSILACHGNHGN
mgnify:CR=1 FL=1